MVKCPSCGGKAEVVHETENAIFIKCLQGHKRKSKPVLTWDGKRFYYAPCEVTVYPVFVVSKNNLKCKERENIHTVKQNE